MSERLRRILASVLFTAGAFALLFVLTGLLKPITYSRDTWRDYKALAPNSVDVVVVGNSHAYTSYAPMQTWRDYQITTWNIGASAINMRTKRAYVEELLKTQTPEVLALEVHPLEQETVVGDRENKWAYDFMPWSASRIAAIVDTAVPTKWERYLFPISNNHQNYVDFSVGDFAKWVGIKDDPSRGGANALITRPPSEGDAAADGNAQGLPGDAANNDGANGDAGNGTGETAAVEDESAAEKADAERTYAESVVEIRRIADMCEERDIQLLLWLGPVEEGFTGADNPLIKLEAELKADYPDIVYSNSSDHAAEIGLTPEDYRDWGHIYAWGMKKHTAWFVETVLADLGITGPSDTPDTAWWDRESAQWNPPSSLAEADAQEGDK